MSDNMYDAVIIGGGHNGLVAASYLAKGGKRVLVLERRSITGGAAVTEEIFPGFKFSTCAYTCAGLRPSIIQDLELAQHGLEILSFNPSVLSPLPSGEFVLLWNEAEKSRKEIARFSKKDAAKYEKFCAQIERLARFMESVFAAPPPNVAASNLALLWENVGAGLRLLRLSKEDKIQLMRLAPISQENATNYNAGPVPGLPRSY